MNNQKQKRKNDEQEQSRLHLSIPAIIGLVYIAFMLATASYHAILPASSFGLIVYPYVMMFAIIHIISVVVIMLVWQLVWRKNEHITTPLLLIFLGLAITIGLLGVVNIKHYLVHIGTVRVSNSAYHFARVQSPFSETSRVYDVFECHDGIGILCRRMGITTDDGDLLYAYPYSLRTVEYITYDMDKHVWIYISGAGEDHNIQVTR